MVPAGRRFARACSFAVVLAACDGPAPVELDAATADAWLELDAGLDRFDAVLGDPAALA